MNASLFALGWFSKGLADAVLRPEVAVPVVIVLVMVAAGALLFRRAARGDL